MSRLRNKGLSRLMYIYIYRPCCNPYNILYTTPTRSCWRWGDTKKAMYPQILVLVTTLYEILCNVIQVKTCINLVFGACHTRAGCIYMHATCIFHVTCMDLGCMLHASYMKNYHTYNTLILLSKGASFDKIVYYTHR